MEKLQSQIAKLTAEMGDMTAGMEDMTIKSRFGLQRFAGSDEDIRFYTR